MLSQVADVIKKFLGGLVLAVAEPHNQFGVAQDK